MRLALALLLLCVSACATLPQRGRLAMRDVPFPERDLRHASGLRILVEQDTRRPVVAVVALVGEGSASDPKGKEGLAHPWSSWGMSIPPPWISSSPSPCPRGGWARA